MSLTTTKLVKTESVETLTEKLDTPNHAHFMPETVNVSGRKILHGSAKSQKEMGK